MEYILAFMAVAIGIFSILVAWNVHKKYRHSENILTYPCGCSAKHILNAMTLVQIHEKETVIKEKKQWTVYICPWTSQRWKVYKPDIVDLPDILPSGDN